MIDDQRFLQNMFIAKQRSKRGNHFFLNLFKKRNKLNHLRLSINNTCIVTQNTPHKNTPTTSYKITQPKYYTHSDTFSLNQSIQERKIRVKFSTIFK